MTIFNIFSLFGGLGLFLYGMNMTSKGLEIAAGDKLKSILEKLTSNRFLGVLVGAIITAIIQSSSATTVMVVGFVNSGLMKLDNAIWVIMGANIGTTITGQLVAIKVTDYAPMILFLGVALIVFFKSKKLDAYGGIICGIGMIFVGMETMSSAMIPLRTMDQFLNILTHFSNPLIGILVGALFTAVIQSSAASVGILQALALSGTLTLPNAIYVLYGQNIGTCVTSVLASIGANRNAKRATTIHLTFNIIGTVVFVFISMFTPFASIIQELTPTNVAAQIANVHTIFNGFTTLILLPFGKYIVKFSYYVLPIKENQEEELAPKYLDFSIFKNDYYIGTRAIAGKQLLSETLHMIDLAKKNVNRSFNLLKDFNESTYKEVLKQSQYVDYLNEQIIQYTICALSSVISDEASTALGSFISIVNDVEKINTHALHMANIAYECYEKKSEFSNTTITEISELSELTNSILKELKIVSQKELKTIVENVKRYEQEIEERSKTFSAMSILRLKDKVCKPYNSSLYTQVLNDISRIGNYSKSIASSYYELQGEVIDFKVSKKQA